MHLNDSKTDLGSKKDRHESIGLYVLYITPTKHTRVFGHRGFLGLGAFRQLMNDPRVQNIPLILETPSFEQPSDVWGREIAVLQRLSASVAGAKENKVVFDSIIGDAQTDDALIEVVKGVVKKLQGEPKGKKPTGKKGGKSGKRKRGGESEEEDEDE